jgi:glutamate/tyrosine decarboxylase-like PLP-dependent enzyme
MKITLVKKLEAIKSNWWIWQAEREDADGTITTGSVQADLWGEMIAEETWEGDDD